MSFFLDRNRIYLVLFYLSISLLYLSTLFDGERTPLSLLGYILALILAIIASHDTLLRVISQATGHANSNNELSFFSAFIELNRKLHNCLEVDDVLVLVNETMREKMQLRRIVYLLSKDIQAQRVHADEPLDVRRLRAWPDDRRFSFHTREFEREVEKRSRVLGQKEATAALLDAFSETGTTLLIPVVQNGKTLCIILVGSSDRARPYSEFELQMFGYLANQLSIILDRIRVYAKVMQQTAMDYAEKMQVMQSLSANIAHEMRTPLSGIRASISGVEEYLPQLLDSHSYALRQEPERFPAIRENHLNTLQSTPRRIMLMIDQANTVIDMLLMNLRENSLDRRQLNPCSAADIVNQAVDRYPFRSGERERLHLHLEEDFVFLGIESLCIYLLFNLLKNAYYSLRSAQKGEITIRLMRGDTRGQLLFRDTGLGIHADIIGRIFDGFFTTKSDGTGVGLAFCKRTVQSFDGKIECHSIPGEFAEFTITLPQYNGELAMEKSADTQETSI